MPNSAPSRLVRSRHLAGHTAMIVHLTPEMHDYLGATILERIPEVIRRLVVTSPEEKRLFDVLLEAARATGPHGVWIEHEGVKEALWNVLPERRRVIVKGVERVISGAVPNCVGLTKPELIEEILDSHRRRMQDAEVEATGTSDRPDKRKNERSKAGRPGSEAPRVSGLSEVRARRRRRQEASDRVPVPA